MDPEILARLIRSRCADEIDDDEFEQIKRGLGLARADQDGEDDDEDSWSRVCSAIIDVIDALEAKMTQFEQTLQALGARPDGSGDQAEPQLDLPPGNIGVLEPVQPEPGFVAAPEHGFAGA
jgi:hypothetical protein